MAIRQLSELDDYKLTHNEQDCRGWCVVNASGTQIGTVREMLVDEEHARVTALVLDSGVQILVDEVSLRDGKVVTAESDLEGELAGALAAERAADRAADLAADLATTGGTTADIDGMPPMRGTGVGRS